MLHVLFPLRTLNMVTRLIGTSRDIKNIQESRGPNFDVPNKGSYFHVNA